MQLGWVHAARTKHASHPGRLDCSCVLCRVALMGADRNAVFCFTRPCARAQRRSEEHQISHRRKLSSASSMLAMSATYNLSELTGTVATDGLPSAMQAELQEAQRQPSTVGLLSTCHTGAGRTWVSCARMSVWGAREHTHMYDIQVCKWVCLGKGRRMGCDACILAFLSSCNVPMRCLAGQR